MSDIPSLLSIGDLVDKLSILSRKLYFGEESARDETQAIITGLEELGYDGELLAASIKLAQANFEIWNLENAMRRDGREIADLTEDELIDYGKRALRIRALNRLRVQHKNVVNGITSGYREAKVRHASQ